MLNDMGCLIFIDLESSDLNYVELQNFLLLHRPHGFEKIEEYPKIIDFCWFIKNEEKNTGWHICDLPAGRVVAKGELDFMSYLAFLGNYQ